ncbi:uncharacterized protein LOC143280376 [Babylonia areolata]|uniref:uncharacterized protein LOC143280376 n=1 Tax=Babylonia areolata TaxID=304850 RepID=UPI003FD4C1C0
MGNVIAINGRHQDTRMTVGLFNTQSVGSKSKRTQIVDFIKDENMDILFLTETWLKTSGDESKCADLVPPGYKLRSFPRATRELPDLLDYCNLLRGKSVVVGDFNVHYDVPADPLTSKVLDIVSRFDFTQGVQEATYYRSGHILDWVLHREADQLIHSCRVNHMVSSDHAAVLCRLKVSRPKRQPVYRTVRDIKAIDRDSFKADVQDMLDDLGPDLSAQQLDDGLRGLLDRHAPATEKRVPSGHTSPWYAAVSDILRDAKKERRRAERKWRKSGLTVDSQIFLTAKQLVTDIVQNAKEEYWSSKIKASTSVKNVFLTSNRLLGRSRDFILPTNIPPNDLSDAFAEFFTTKIKTIRDELETFRVSLGFSPADVTIAQLVVVVCLWDVFPEPVLRKGDPLGSGCHPFARHDRASACISDSAGCVMVFGSLSCQVMFRMLRRRQRKCERR